MRTFALVLLLGALAPVRDDVAKLIERLDFIKTAKIVE